MSILNSRDDKRDVVNKTVPGKTKKQMVTG
jgi:hypothetical protein